MSGPKKPERATSKSEFKWDSAKENAPERAIVLVPDFLGKKYPPNPENGTSGKGPYAPLQRSLDARIAEASGLARAIDLKICEALGVPVRALQPATLFGKGKVEELGALIASHDAGLAIIDHAISPVQQQNLEETWNCKVLDRTALILEIFGERAQTREGRAQVELAHLNYQKSRLVRSWTHLERQRGGLGFVGGPGETQIEADKRMIAKRIKTLEGQLEKIKRTRTLHRAKRRKIPHPVVALVGYTNAGKSTLFNRVTGAEVYVKDQLFATLDPTLRQLELPGGTRVILSDTVGFVSNLPTHLIAAFRATLEEVIEADIIVHVCDISDADADVQRDDVYQILQQLGVDTEDDALIIEAWNKTDLLDKERYAAIEQLRTGSGDGPENENMPVLISSLDGSGVDALLSEIERRITRNEKIMEITLSVEALGKLNWIYENTIILSRRDNEDGSVRLKLRVNSKSVNELNSIAQESVGKNE